MATTINPTTQPSQAAREAAAALTGADISDGKRCVGSYDQIYGPAGYAAAVQAFARFERDTEKRVRDNAAWARLETWGEAQKVCQHGLDGLTFASDVSEERRTAVRSGIELCIAAIHQASQHDPKAQPSLGSLPPESLVGEANVERVARVIELAIMRHGVAESDLEGTIDDALAALATLERTTDD